MLLVSLGGAAVAPSKPTFKVVKKDTSGDAEGEASAGAAAAAKPGAPKKPGAGAASKGSAKKKTTPGASAASAVAGDGLKKESAMSDDDVETRSNE